MILTDEELPLIKCKNISIFDGINLAKRLEQELCASKTKGVGLSAIQIGEPYKVCIIRSNISLDFINPEIVKKYDLSLFESEGCLSFPNQTVATKRYAEIVVKDLLHPAGIILAGINAVIAAHEIDHGLGITMFDRQVKIPKLNERCWCGSGKKFKKCCVGKVI